MTLVLFLAAAGLVLFAAWCADPGEYAAWPRVNRAQNVLAFLFACFLVAGGLWLVVR